MTIAVIDLGGTRTKFGLVRDGAVVMATNCKAEAGGSIATHLDQVVECLEGLCLEAGIKLSDCEGIGLLSTGVVDNRRMMVLSTNGKYDDATGFDFKAWALAKTGLELRMDNDARGATIGEWRFGAGQGCDNMVMVTIGTGIGTSVIMDGRPLIGPHFTAGLLGGHILVNSGGKPCTCGAVGCLEAEASGWALPGLVKNHPNYSQSTMATEKEINFKALFENANSGDKVACEVRDRCLQLWSEAVVSFIHLYDPERVVIGGGVMNAPGVVIEHVRKVVKAQAWAEDEQVQILKAHHPDNAGLIGAAALF